MIANAELLTAPSNEIKLSSCGSPMARPPENTANRMK